MKVYCVFASSGAGSPRQRYAALCPASEREAGRDFNEFEGQPYSKKWRPAKVYIDKPRLPRPDFFSYDSKVLVCNERAIELAGEPMEMAGELLPIEVEREKIKLYMLNVTECINVLDYEASDWEELLPGTKLLDKPAFLPDRFGEHTSLFKIPEGSGLKIYCLERSGDVYDGEFKALVEHHRLTGLEFELIWTDRKVKAKKKAKTPKKAKRRAAKRRKQ